MGLRQVKEILREMQGGFGVEGKVGYFCSMMAESSKHIGLVTWFGTPNYGTSLQAYALYKALEARGFNARIIKRFSTPFTLKNIKENFFYAHGIRRFWKYPQPFPAKIRKIRRFCHQEMQIATVSTGHDLQRLLNSTDLFVAGSDQLWNCYDHFRGFEFLDFAGGKPKISYATSIGTRDIPAEYQEKAKQYLADFQHISIREQSGASSIAQVTGRTDIKTVLDPVLLQERAFWEQVADKADIRLPQAGYVLYYILKRTAEEDVPVFPIPEGKVGAVILPSGENPDFQLPGAQIIPDAGIREFVALVRSADLIVTDSFHGTALSIVFSKPFISLKRFSDGDNASQNIRIRDLCERLGIGGDGEEVDYTSVQQKLELLRKESNAYLDQALGAVKPTAR